MYGIAANRDITSVNLKGVRKGEATSVAIIPEDSGINARIGSETYRYNSLLNENSPEKIISTDRMDFSARSLNSIICSRKGWLGNCSSVTMVNLL